MRNSLTALFLSAIACATGANAADISFGGYLLNRSDWRDATTEKYEASIRIQGDLDGDQILGSSGYALFGPSGQEGGRITITDDWASVAMTEIPGWVDSWKFASGAEMVRYPGYAAIDHPERADLKITSGALVLTGNGGEQPLFELTFGAGAPEYVRIGFMVDNLDQGFYNANSFLLTSADQSVGPIVTSAQAGSANGVPDFYFFDVSRAREGDTINFFAEAGSGSLITLGAVTFDSYSSNFYSEFSHPGHYLKDFFVYQDGGTYHLFYNIGLADGKQHWEQPFNEKQFGHATSKDLKTWVIHDTILPVVPGTWESDVVSAPFVVRHDYKFYMAYTGFGGGTANQRMGIATSDDLFSWTRIRQNPVAEGPSWTAWRDEGWADFRDPALLEWRGQWIAFNTITDPQGEGGLAISTSNDLINWEHLPRERSILTNWKDPESPVAFKRKDKVYLIASSGHGRQMWMTDDPLSGKWEKLPFVFPKAGFWSGFEVLEGPEGQLLICAFQWKMHGNFIRFWEVEWDGDLPVLKQ